MGGNFHSRTTTAASTWMPAACPNSRMVYWVSTGMARCRHCSHSGAVSAGSASAARNTRRARPSRIARRDCLTPITFSLDRSSVSKQIPPVLTHKNSRIISTQSLIIPQSAHRVKHYFPLFSHFSALSYPMQKAARCGRRHLTKYSTA